MTIEIMRRIPVGGKVGILVAAMALGRAVRRTRRNAERERGCAEESKDLEIRYSALSERVHRPKPAARGKKLDRRAFLYVLFMSTILGSIVHVVSGSSLSGFLMTLISIFAFKELRFPQVVVSLYSRVENLKSRKGRAERGQSASGGGWRKSNTSSSADNYVRVSKKMEGGLPWQEFEVPREYKEGVDLLRRKFPESVEFHSDYDLSRFVKESNGDTKKLIRSYSAYVTVYRPSLFVSPEPEVRKVSGLNTVSSGSLPQRSRELTSVLQTYHDYFLDCGICGCDRLGRPVVYMRGGTTLSRQDELEKMGLKKLPLWLKLAFQASSQEQLLVLLHKASHARGIPLGAVQVMDLGGMSVQRLVKFALGKSGKEEAAFNTTFFPSIFDRVVIINAPPGSSVVWSIASRFLSQKLREKISIHGCGYKSYLKKIIDARFIPRMYGGLYSNFEWQQKPPLSSWPNDLCDSKAYRGRAILGQGLLPLTQ